MLSFHSRSAITANVLDYYNVSQSDVYMTPSELKREVEYEDKLVAQMRKYQLFEGRNPDKLTTIINKDVTPPHIEQSLLNSEPLGREDLKQFMKNRLCHVDGENKPKVAFSASMKKITAPTFSNLFDVDPPNSEKKDVINASRDCIKRLAVAWEAGRPVDMKQAASHEMLSVPLNLFHTDKTMRSGKKADLMNLIRGTAKVNPSQNLPNTPPNESQHVVDGMAHVYHVNRKGLNTFGEFANKYCDDIYKIQASRIDIVGDRYDGPSTKDGQREKRVNKKKGKKKYKTKAVPKVVTATGNLPQGDDFIHFLKLDENKKELQILLGTALIENAPPDKVIVVNGAFEDPTGVRCSSNMNLDDLVSDHTEADTRMVLSIMHSQATTVVVESQDTDVFVILIANNKHFGEKRVFMKQKSGNETKITDIGETVKGLEKEGINTESLPLLHSITGCDATSYPFGIGKVTAWAVYKEFHALLDSIIVPGNPSQGDYDHAEQFICKLFKQNADKLDDTRGNLLTANDIQCEKFFNFHRSSGW